MILNNILLFKNFEVGECSVGLHFNYDALFFAIFSSWVFIPFSWMSYPSAQDFWSITSAFSRNSRPLARQDCYAQEGFQSLWKHYVDGALQVVEQGEKTG